MNWSHGVERFALSECILFCLQKNMKSHGLIFMILQEKSRTDFHDFAGNVDNGTRNRLFEFTGVLNHYLDPGIF